MRRSQNYARLRTWTSSILGKPGSYRITIPRYLVVMLEIGARDPLTWLISPTGYWLLHTRPHLIPDKPPVDPSGFPLRAFLIEAKPVSNSLFVSIPPYISTALGLYPGETILWSNMQHHTVELSTSRRDISSGIQLLLPNQRRN
jgi:hypothetical protein